jgi:putative ABC transport system permease protein
MKNKSLGLSSENIITIDVENMGNEQRLLLRDKLKEFSGTVNLSLCSRDFIDGGSIAMNINKGDGEQIEVFFFKADDQYIPTLDLKLLYGENFTASNITRNDRAVIVNDEFIKRFNIEDDPIGKTYQVGNVNFSIIGVVNNYHFKDVRRKIEPAMLYARDHFANPYNYLLVKFQPEQLSGLLEHLKKSYNEIVPDRNLNYGFWDNKLENRYQTEERWAKIVGYASVIAIIISSLGLFGLTILLINQRIKEIGVRKVNGARISEVLTTIVKPFIVWLIFSILLATPIAYLIVSKWLNNFAFRIDISWWIFAMAGSMTLVIALVTVSWQSWRAANKNPVEALRYE